MNKPESARPLTIAPIACSRTPKCRFRPREIAAANVAALFDRRLGGAGQIRRAADQRRDELGHSLLDLSGVVARGVGFRRSHRKQLLEDVVRHRARAQSLPELGSFAVELAHRFLPGPVLGAVLLDARLKGLVRALRHVERRFERPAGGAFGGFDLLCRRARRRGSPPYPPWSALRSRSGSVPRSVSAARSPPGLVRAPSAPGRGRGHRRAERASRRLRSALRRPR